MTQSRKISLALVTLLVLALLAAIIIPLSSVGNTASAASAIDSWTNTYKGNYYNNLNTNKTGKEFRADLAELITTTHTKQYTYDNLKELYKTTDADPDKQGNVIWFYTGNSVPYTGVMDGNDTATKNYPTNREHVWPKMGGNAFPEKTEAGSDAHHVRPLNTGLNNTRSNNHFGEVPQTEANRIKQSGTFANYGNSDPDSWCYQATVNGAKLFYPAAGYRGATARIIFYVQTRWGDVSDLSLALGNNTTKIMSNVDVLLKWHLEEPPTEEEIRRNEAVFGLQGNRNPFIDHPEYAEMIYCNDGNAYNSALVDVVNQYGSYIKSNNGNNGNKGTGSGNTQQTPTKPTQPTNDKTMTIIIAISVAVVVLVVVAVVIVVIVKKSKKKA